MRVLVIGRTGQLATELRRAPWPAGTTLDCLGRGELDLLDPVACSAAVATARPDLLINAAAYTAVDRAEAERADAFAVNCLALRHLAAAVQGRHVPFIHISTDYVFDGRSNQPWRENDKANPLGVYGQSKLAGERAIQAMLSRYVIVRTSWLFASHGQNFVRTMLRLGRERDTLRIVGDQIGCPTPAADLARVLVEIGAALVAGKPGSGVYHYACSGPVSWHAFAHAIFDAAGDLVPRKPTLQAITTSEFRAPAARPAYSVLNCGKIEAEFGIRASAWLPGLRGVLEEIRRNASGDPNDERVKPG